MKDSKGRRLMVELPGYKTREPTVEEFEKALQVEQQRTELENKIQSLQKELKTLDSESVKMDLKVFYDTAGSPYDVRHFIVTDSFATI